MQKPTVVVAFDCEGCGPNHITHGLKSLGVVVGSLEGTIIYKFRLDFEPLPGQSVDQKCYEDFYQRQNPGLWEALTSGARPASEAIRDFNNFLTTYEDMYDLYLLTDAPSYDASLVNYYLMYHGYLPLHFTRAGAFRPVHDADSYARGLTRDPSIWVSNADLIKRYDIEMPTSLVAHYPENDAEIIYRLHVELIKQ